MTITETAVERQEVNKIETRSKSQNLINKLTISWGILANDRSVEKTDFDIRLTSND